MLQRIVAAYHRRAIPTTIRALRCCHASYSMHGEDRIADSVLRNGGSVGRYVDIGCFDPQKWSNTYRFYMRGWRGICVDPNPAYERAWRTYRPRDVFLNLAVSAKAGTAMYLSRDRCPQENSLVAVNDLGKRQGRRSIVKTERLQRILEKHHPPGVAIDLMSVDCEGHDLVVLQSNDFDRFRPRVLIVEDHQRARRSEIDEFCEQQGYALVGLTVVSKVFEDTRPAVPRRRNR